MTLSAAQIIPVLVFLLTASNTLRAQSPEASTSGERLEQLITAEQSALDANDPAQILASGRQLGSFALRLLGSFYTSEGECAPAGEAYRQSIFVNETPENLSERVQTELLVLTADLCAKRPDAAGTAAEQVIGMAGDTAQVHLLIANARHGMDDLPGAIAELSTAVARDQGYGPAHLALADAFWELNEYQYNPDTLREFTAAQRLTPNDFYANQGLGSVLSQYERYQEAYAYLRNAIAADPSSPDPWLQLGMNAYAQSHLDEAATALEKAVALTGQNEYRNGYQIRRAYAALSRIKEQLRHAVEAEKYARQESVLHRTMLNAGIALPLSESTGMAVNHAQKAAEKAASEPVNSQTPEQRHEIEQRLKAIVAKSLNDAGTVLARDRNYEAALPLFRLASTSDPDLQPVMRNLGLAAFHTGAYDTAVAALTSALERHPEDALVRTDLEQSRAMLSQPARAPRP